MEVKVTQQSINQPINLTPTATPSCSPVRRRGLRLTHRDVTGAGLAVAGEELASERKFILGKRTVKLMLGAPKTSYLLTTESTTGMFHSFANGTSRGGECLPDRGNKQPDLR